MNANALALDTAPTQDQETAPRKGVGAKLSGIFKRAAAVASGVKTLVRDAIASPDTNDRTANARAVLKNIVISAATGAIATNAVKLSCAAAFSCAASPVALTVAGTAAAMGVTRLALNWHKDRKNGVHYNLFSRETVKRNWKSALLSTVFSGLGGASAASGLWSHLIPQAQAASGIPPLPALPPHDTLTPFTPIAPVPTSSPSLNDVGHAVQQGLPDTKIPEIKAPDVKIPEVKTAPIAPAHSAEHVSAAPKVATPTATDASAKGTEHLSALANGEAKGRFSQDTYQHALEQIQADNAAKEAAARAAEPVPVSVCEMKTINNTGGISGTCTNLDGVVHPGETVRVNLDGKDIKPDFKIVSSRDIPTLVVVRNLVLPVVRESNREALMGISGAATASVAP